MLPVGPMARRAMRGEPRMSNFTEDEQRTMLSLWSVFSSPLMVGCNLPEIDEFTLSLLTNPDVIELDQTAKISTELVHNDSLVVWKSEAEHGNDMWYAVFNLSDEELSGYELALPENLKSARELWKGETMALDEGKLLLSIPPHGVALLKCEF